MNPISDVNPTELLQSSINLVSDSENHAVEWEGHEHVSEQVQREAEKLVHMVGSPELAKHAINVVEQRLQGSTSIETDTLPTGLTNRNESFLKALSDFETSIATPVVSGELTEWVTNALRACENLGAIERDDLQRLHAELYAGILREDLDLSSQVEKLRATDSQLAFIDCNEVATSLENLLSLARSAKQDEAKLNLVLADITKQAMEFVIAARTQETVIATWYSEAFNRDLGSGD